MAQQQADLLRREAEALEAENELLWAQVQRSGFGLEGCHPPRGADAGEVEVLQREQDTLMAGLKLGEELLRLRNENSAIVAQTQDLYEDNAVLRRENAELHDSFVAAERALAERQPEKPPARSSSERRPSGRRHKESPPAPAPRADSSDARKMRRSASQPQRPEQKPFVLMREERRDMVAAQLKAGLVADSRSGHDAFPGAWPDAPSVSPPPRGAPLVPRPLPGKAKPSLSEEPSFNREMAVRDMLRGLSAI